MNKRWKYMNPLDGNRHDKCVTDTELSWCAIKVTMHQEGEDAEEVAAAIAEFLYKRFSTVNQDKAPEFVRCYDRSIIKYE